MVPELPNQFSALVNQVMVQETKHWREQSSLEIQAFTTAQKSPAGEAGQFHNFVQKIFDINFRLTTPNFYDNRGNSSNECCLCDPGVNFWEMCTFTGPVCVYHVSPPRAHLKKENYYVIQAPL